MNIIVRVLNEDPDRDIMKCRLRTRGKAYNGQSPTDAQVLAMYIAEESPIEVIQYMIECFDVPKSVRNQIFRATKKLPRFFAETSRPDLTGKPRDDSGSTNFIIVANTAAILEIAKQRLCGKTEANTRHFVRLLKRTLCLDENKYSSALGYAMVPYCLYQNGCKFYERGCKESPFMATEFIPSILHRTRAFSAAFVERYST